MGSVCNTPASQRNLGMEFLRILSSFLVVLLHTGAYLFQSDWGEAGWSAPVISQGVARMAVPLFVMLSGAFLLDPNKPFDTKRFFKKNLLRLAAAFAFWSLLYAIYDTAKYRTDLSLSTAVYFGVSFLQGYHHMWYLKMMMGLYLITPILRRVCENKKHVLWIVCLAAVFFVLPNVLTHVPLAGEYAASFLKSFDIRFVGGYLLYFLAGHWLYTYPLPKKRRILLYILGVCGVCVTVLGTLALSVQKGESTTVLFDYHFPNVYLSAFALFTACKEGNRFLHPSDRTSKRITGWSSLTFGIYLVHMFILYLSAHIFTNHAYPFLTLPLQAICIYFVSAVVICLMKKIPVLNKYTI